MKAYSKNIIKSTLEDNKNLGYLAPLIIRVVDEMVIRIRKGGKLLICGNGGSASDSEHMVGELMKEFYIKRPINKGTRESLLETYGEEGEYIANRLQGAIPSISLVSQTSFITAYENDVDAHFAFAQEVFAYGNKNDIFIGLSTSGKAKNVIYGAKVAMVQELMVVAMTGESGGELKNNCHFHIKVPSNDTYKIEEYHLVVYHVICRVLEEEIFGKEI